MGACEIARSMTCPDSPRSSVPGCRRREPGGGRLDHSCKPPLRELGGVPMSAATKAEPTIKIQPLRDRVLILPAEEAETMRGPLYIPDTAKEKPTQGKVLAVGPGRIWRGERIKLDVE